MAFSISLHVERFGYGRICSEDKRRPGEALCAVSGNQRRPGAGGAVPEVAFGGV